MNSSLTGGRSPCPACGRCCWSPSSRASRSTATGVTLTLHVVLDLDRGYGAAGLVGAAVTVGAAIGGPLLGRLVDRRGLRPVLVLTAIAEAIFWVHRAVADVPACSCPASFGRLPGPARLLGGPSVDRRAGPRGPPPPGLRPGLDVAGAVLHDRPGAGGCPGHRDLRADHDVSGRWRHRGRRDRPVVLNPPIREATSRSARNAGCRAGSWLTPRCSPSWRSPPPRPWCSAGTDVAVVAVLRASGEVGWTGAVAGPLGGRLAGRRLRVRGRAPLALPAGADRRTGAAAPFRWGWAARTGGCCAWR